MKEHKDLGGGQARPVVNVFPQLFADIRFETYPSALYTLATVLRVPLYGSCP